MSGNAGEHITGDVIATTVPDEVIEPHGQNSFAVPGDLARDEEKGGFEVTATTDDEEYPAPTEEEKKTLRKIADNLPIASYALCIVEFAERASYYGAQTVFSNFIEFPLPKGGNGAGAPPRGSEETAGALGLGLQASNGLVLAFTFLAYVIPIFGGWLADVKTGRYTAIVIGVLICGIAHIISIFGALPSVLQAGPSHAAPPFIISLVVLAIGAGIFKPNIAPTVLDQHRHQKQYTKVLKSGEKVIVDPEVTVQRTMLIFYAMVNVGAFYAVATAWCERLVGYWLAYLLAGIIYFLLPIVLFAIYKRTKRYPPTGSELTKAIKIIFTALRRNHFRFWRKNFWDAAKPSVLAAQGVTNIGVDWDDKLVDDVRRTVSASAIFLYFPVWNLNDGGIGSVSTNQAASMTTAGAPNDLLSNFNPLTIIVTVPLLSHVIYPWLNRHKIKFGRISRITFGFILATISGVIGAIVQWRVYKTSPCGYYASTCDGVSPLSVWWQIPNVSLGAISECFCNVTAYELAYARSPKSMKGLVMAIFLFMTSLSSALGEIILPWTVDPYLIWIWLGPAIALAVQTVIFWFRYKHLNDDEFMTYEEDYPKLEEVQQTSEVSQEKTQVL
ncbi:hypothetical protein VTN77DRAFT_255 [Rasamsonia byssochlamydoides]|uniref:uncharacterized protein n=1 Tax=Rasamsonia byssochlamydoides TaxID=89139 RepID=UPI0037437D60